MLCKVSQYYKPNCCDLKVGMAEIQIAIKNGANVIGHVLIFASCGKFSLRLQTSTMPYAARILYDYND